MSKKYTIKPISEDPSNGYVAEVSDVCDSQGCGAGSYEVLTDLEDYIIHIIDSSDPTEHVQIDICSTSDLVKIER